MGMRVRVTFCNLKSVSALALFDGMKVSFMYVNKSEVTLD
jgi:hypothetical protein